MKDVYQVLLSSTVQINQLESNQVLLSSTVQINQLESKVSLITTRCLRLFVVVYRVKML